MDGCISWASTGRLSRFLNSKESFVVCFAQQSVNQQKWEEIIKFKQLNIKNIVLFPSRTVTSPLSLDTNTAHPLLIIADDLRSVTRVKSRQTCPAHPERFDHWPQVLTVQTFSSGTHYWELEAEGFWDIGVCYRSIGRKGKDGNAFGNNKVCVPPSCVIW